MPPSQIHRYAVHAAKRIGLFAATVSCALTSWVAFGMAAGWF